jgi:aryl-alcohol dehydrogenase-like predicted oxidoreductase
MPLSARPLGTTGLEVTPLCLGTMMFGAWGATSEAQCSRILHAALDAGINTIDTADIYSFGEAEEYVGRALQGRRDDVVLATKFGNPMSDDPAQRGASRRWMHRAVEDSLRRLGTDRIDLYQVHRPDPDTDIDETLSALGELVDQGKVRAFGTSTFPASALVLAEWAAARRGLRPFTTEQPPYSIFNRGIEAEVLPVCQQLGLGVLVWAPLNGGWLTGKYRRGVAVPSDARGIREAEHFDLHAAAAEEKLSLVEELLTLAGDCGLTLPQLALGFVLAHPAVTTAIIGPRTVEQLESVLGAHEVRLETAVLDRIDALVAPGRNVNPADAGYVPPALADPSRRRR